MSNVRQLRPSALQNRAARYFAVHEYLASARSWTTQSQITTAVGVSGVQMRQLCQAYPRTFISSIDGYKYVGNASSTEIRYSVQSLLKRAEKIMSRARALTGRI